MRVEKDFVEFCESLNATGIEYLIVGGFALGHHGAPRYTQDLDVFVNPSPAAVRAASGRARAVRGLQGPGRTGTALGEHILELGVVPIQFHVMTSYRA